MNVIVEFQSLCAKNSYRIFSYSSRPWTFSSRFFKKLKIPKNLTFSYLRVSQITFAFFGIFWHFLTTYVPCLHFLCIKLPIFLTTYPPLSGNIICESSLRPHQKFTFISKTNSCTLSRLIKFKEYSHFCHALNSSNFYLMS